MVMPPDYPKILIVDDKPQNLYTLERLLIKLDVLVFQATSGFDALALTLEHDFCVAIIDIQMPEMDGYELVEMLRSNQATASLPVIFVSAIYSDEYHHRKAYDTGVVDFLSKPFVPEILLSKVNVFIALYHQRHRLQTLVKQLNAANDEILRFNQELEDKVNERTEELQRAYRQLELLDRNKSDFIQVISHELRTPLSVFTGYSQLLLNMPQIQSDEMLSRMVSNLHTSSLRLKDIVNAMLEVVKVDSQTLELHYVQVSIADLLDLVYRGFRDALTERNLSLEMVGVADLPLIEADAQALHKVFKNLVNNAIKYTPDGGQITIRGQLQKDEEIAPAQSFVHIMVCDTGIGIDSEVQELIFTKFYHTGDASYHSSGETKFKGGGPGLGLALAKGFVEAHGGRIWAESAGYDEHTCPGSQFHVLLPF